MPSQLAFDEGRAGEAARLVISNLANALVTLRANPKLYAGVLQFIGSRIRMAQADRKESFPLWQTVPEEFVVEPFVPAKEQTCFFDLIVALNKTNPCPATNYATASFGLTDY